MTSISPGVECPACGRKVPEVHDKPPGQKATRFSVAEPPGEGGLLDELLLIVVERIQKVWDDGDTIEVGSRTWRYRGLHLALESVASCSDDLFSQLFATGDE